ncbi:ATP:cob(I)alamin adenosyltransferase [Patescibacteria group bacterium]
MSNFILPGGSIGAVYTHLARSICRRTERQVVALAQNESIDNVVIRYLNRLSDLLFIIARYINKKEKVKEEVWMKKS